MYLLVILLLYMQMPLFRIEGQSLMYISQDEQEAVEAVEIFLTDDTKHEV